jgi:hypothetical protein
MEKLKEVVKLAVSISCYHQLLEKYFGCPQELTEKPFLSAKQIKCVVKSFIYWWSFSLPFGRFPMILL